MWSPYGAQINSLTKVSKPRRMWWGWENKSSDGFKASVAIIGRLLQYIADTPKKSSIFLWLKTLKIAVGTKCSSVSRQEQKKCYHEHGR